MGGEVNTIERVSCLVSREKVGLPCHTGPVGSIRSSVGAEAGVRGEPGGSLYRGRQGRLGLANLNSPGRRWAKGVVSGCLVCGPEMTSGRVNIALVCESYIKGGGLGYSLNLVCIEQAWSWLALDYL